MAKAKKKKQISSEAVYAKKSKIQPKKLNPFEVHINKEKFKILGRKCKHDRGLPGVSRSKAIQKRKQTLGKEFQEQHKVNKFKDRRIEYANQVDKEELANARFMAEKLSQFKTKKSDIFNLNDDEILTHRGQTLEEIEQFQDIRSDDSEDEALDAEFTEAAHFGGGDNKMDRKALIEEKIIEAKQKKMEMIREKEKVNNLIAKVDTTYKDILPLMMKWQQTGDELKPKPDDYDRALREMIFEPRGQVTDKQQTEEEIARKEKERLEQLEKERQKRMLGEEDEHENNKPKHRSADDLDDGYFVGSGDEEQEGILAYSLDEKVNEDNGNESNSYGEEDDWESNAGDEDDGSEINEQEDINGEEEEKEEDDEDENNALDYFKEFGSKRVEEEDDEDENDALDYFKEFGSKGVEEEDGEDENDALDYFKELESKKEKKQEDIELNSQSLKHENSRPEMKQNADNNNPTDKLSFVYDMPTNYKSFRDRLDGHTPENQATILERTLKCNHPKLDPSNRERVVHLFSYVLKYLDEIFSKTNATNIETSLKIFSKLSPSIYDIVNSNSKTSQCLLDVITNKYSEYKKNRNIFPQLNTVILFKLVSNLYSTSDFRHPVVTPCFIFISHILSRARIRTPRDICLGLFVITVFLEYTQISKRFLPAVFNYLLGALSLCIEKNPIEIFKVIPSFSSSGPLNNVLVLKETCSPDIKETQMKPVDLMESNVDEGYKVRVLNTILKLMTDSMDNIRENVGAGYYAELFLDMMGKLDVDSYPEFIRENYEKLVSLLNAIKEKPLQRLVPPEKKPKCLRLMEPRIEKVFNDKRRPKLSKEKEERVKLIHKVKRETKGAVREIRRDTAFLTKMQIKRQLESDKERKEKVQRIYAEAAAQQGELNEMARKRKKM